MQKTTNKDGWYTDVLRNDQLNKNYIITLVLVSVIQDNSCFWAYEICNNGYHFSCPITEYVQLIVICDLSDGLLIRSCLKTLVFLHLKQETVKRKKGVEILNTSHSE